MEDEDLILSEEHRAKLDGIVQEMTTNNESEENIQWVVNDFKNKYGTTPKGVTAEENGGLVSPSANVDSSSESDKPQQLMSAEEFRRRADKIMEDQFLDPNDKARYQNQQRERMSTNAVEGDLLFQAELNKIRATEGEDVAQELVKQYKSDYITKNFPSAGSEERIKAYKDAGWQEVEIEQPESLEEKYKEMSKRSNFKYADNLGKLEGERQDSNNPDRKIDISSTPIKETYGDLEEYGINIEDFNGFVEGTNDLIKKQHRAGFFTTDTTDWTLTRSQEKELRETAKHQTLSNYVNDRVNHLQSRQLGMIKTGDMEGARKVQDEINKTAEGYFKYVEDKLPNYKKAVDGKLAEEYKEYLDQKNIKGIKGKWDTAVRIRNKAIDQLGEGVMGEAGNLSAFLLDITGADDYAEHQRMINSRNQLFETNSLDFGIASGKRVTEKGRDYLVTNNGRIIDIDAGKDITSIASKVGINADEIKKKAESVEEEETEFSTEGLISKGANVLGNLAFQVALTRGVGGTAGITSRTGMMANSMAVQSGMVTASTYEDTLSQLRKAGINDQKSKGEALDLSLKMGVVTAITSLFSPNASAIGIKGSGVDKALTKKLANAYVNGGKDNFKKVLWDYAKAKGVNFTREGFEESLQEITETFAQNTINRQVNSNVGKDALQTEVSKEELIETFVLSFSTAGMLALNGRTSADIRGKLNLMEYLSKDMEQSGKYIDAMSDEGAISKSVADKMKKDLNNYTKYSNKIPDNTKLEQVEPLLDLLDKRGELEVSKKKLDKAFHKDINEKIVAVDEEINNLPQKLKENAKKENNQQEITEGENKPSKSVQEVQNESTKDRDTKKEVVNESNNKEKPTKSESSQETGSNTQTESPSTDGDVQTSIEERKAIKPVNAAAKAFVAESDRTVANREFKSRVDDLVRQGQLTQAQARRIIKRAGTVDTTKPKQVDRFFKYLDKQMGVSMKRDAKNIVKSNKKRVKKISKSQSTTLPPTVKKLAESAVGIDERQLSEESAAEYNSVLESIVNANRNVNSNDYRMVNEDKTIKTLQRLEAEANKSQDKKLAEEAGLNKWDWTPEELEQTVKEMSEKRRNKVKNNLMGMVNDRVSTLTNKTGLSTEAKEFIKAFRTFDLNKLSPASLKEAVKVADNIMQNNNSSGYYDLVSKIKGRENAVETKQAIKDRGLKISNIQKGVMTDIKGLAINLKTIFKDRFVAAIFNRLSGLADLSKNNQLLKNEENKISDRYDSEVKKAKKKNKDILSSENTLLRGIYGQLVQGSTDEDFKINRSRLEQHIDRAKGKAKKKNVRFAEKLEELYNTFSGFNSQQEVMDYMKERNDGNYDLVNFWMNEFDKIKDRLKKNAEEVHGELMADFVTNYLPIKTKYIGSGVDKYIDKEQGRPTFMHGGILQPKPTSAIKARTKTPTLPDSRALDLDFDSVMFNRMFKSLEDIHLSKSKKDVANYFKALKGADIFADETLEAFDSKVEEMMDVYERIPELRSPTAKVMLAGERIIRGVSTKLALASLTQYPKQYVAVAFNVMGRLGGNAGLMMQEMFKSSADIPLLDMYSITARGETQGGTKLRGDKVTKEGETKLYKNIASRVAKPYRRLVDGVDKAVFYSLRKGDVNVARSSWIAFYKDYLKRNGVDLKDVDMMTEHEKIDGDKTRQEAASYAELMVEDTQISSDDARGSSVFNSTQAATVLLRSIFMPYQRFNINSKVRMITDFGNIRSGIAQKDTKLVAEATRSLGSTITEQVTFHAVKIFLLSAMLGMGKEQLATLLGLESEEEDEGKEEFKMKQFKSSVVKDIIPWTMGTLMEDLTIESLNFVSYLDDEDVGDYEDYYEWSKEKKKKNELPWYRYGDNAGFDISSDFGLYVAPFLKAKEAADDFELAFEDEPSVRNKYGALEEYEFTPEQERLMRIMFVADIFSLTVGMEAETLRALKKIQREQRKAAKK